MKDIVGLVVKAGRGGDGRVSFLRQKYQPKGGPDGGLGGNGGDVIIKLDTTLASLSHLAGVRGVEAKSGQRGGPRSMRGANGEDLVVNVPGGTYVWEVATNATAAHRLVTTTDTQPISRASARLEKYELPYVGGAHPERPEDESAISLSAGEELKFKQLQPSKAGWRLVGVIDNDNPTLMVCQGGFGGRGNETFKSSVNQAPLQAEWGSFGEERLLVFELKLWADFGLIGLPNVGKSTLLSIISQAKPKIGDYPFTTLEPNLGLVKKDSKELVVADIPGLIEGASAGKGLGYDFLRHVQHCTGLIYVLSPLAEDLEFLEDAQLLTMRLLIQLKLLIQELLAYDPALLKKEQIVVLTKTDLYPNVLEGVIANLTGSVAEQNLSQKAVPIVAVSGATTLGVDLLIEKLFEARGEVSEEISN